MKVGKANKRICSHSLTNARDCCMMKNCKGNSKEFAELAELVDALDSGSSVRKDFGVQVPGSALF